MKITFIVIRVLVLVLLLELPGACGKSRESPTQPQRTVFYVDARHASYRRDGSPDHPYASIREAVAAAPEGATIIIRPGAYYEYDLRLKRGLTLRADPPLQAVVYQAGVFGEGGIFIMTDGVTVRDLVFVCEAGYREISRALNVNVYVDKQAEDIQVIHNRFVRCGLNLFPVSGEIRDNEFNYTIYAIVGAIKGGEVIFEDNHLRGETYFGPPPDYITYGVYVAGADEYSRTLLRRNRIRGFAYGLHVNLDSRFTAEDNVIENNSIVGIRILQLGGPHPNAYIDLGGGPGGSRGHNVIRNNAFMEEEADWYLGHDLILTGEYAPGEVKVWARYNRWDHDTPAEVDAYDIYDDDEEPRLPRVRLAPLWSGERAHVRGTWWRQRRARECEYPEMIRSEHANGRWNSGLDAGSLCGDPGRPFLRVAASQSVQWIHLPPG